MCLRHLPKTHCEVSGLQSVKYLYGNQFRFLLIGLFSSKLIMTYTLIEVIVNVQQNELYEMWKMCNFAQNSYFKGPYDVIMIIQKSFVIKMLSTIYPKQVMSFYFIPRA